MAWVRGTLKHFKIYIKIFKQHAVNGFFGKQKPLVLLFNVKNIKGIQRKLSLLLLAGFR